MLYAKGDVHQCLSFFYNLTISININNNKMAQTRKLYFDGKPYDEKGLQWTTLGIQESNNDKELRKIIKQRDKEIIELKAQIDILMRVIKES